QRRSSAAARARAGPRARRETDRPLECPGERRAVRQPCGGRGSGLEPAGARARTTRDVTTPDAAARDAAARDAAARDAAARDAAARDARKRDDAATLHVGPRAAARPAARS